VQSEMSLPVGCAAGDPARPGRTHRGHILIMTTSAGKSRNFENIVELSQWATANAIGINGERMTYERKGIGVIAFWTGASDGINIFLARVQLLSGYRTN
jgi:hypothetical protein